jgi:hypothetical protein
MSALTDKIEKWLNARAQPHGCAVCGGHNRTFDQANPITLLPSPSGQACAAVLVTCAKCAHIELFSAFPMGITPEDAKAHAAAQKGNRR